MSCCYANALLTQLLFLHTAYKKTSSAFQSDYVTIMQTVPDVIARTPSDQYDPKIAAMCTVYMALLNMNSITIGRAKSAELTSVSE